MFCFLKVRLNPAESPSYMPPTPEPDPSELQPTKHFKGHWNVWLNDFQKLVFIKSFKEEKVHYNNDFGIHCEISVITEIVL